MEQKKEKGFLFGRTQFILSYAIETWYDVPGLKENTPRTAFIPLTKEEIFALDEATQLAQKYSPHLSETNQATFAALTEKVDKVINEEFGGAAFVKLSTRSPKDSLTSDVNERMSKFLLEELDKGDATENGDTIAFCAATRRAMKVSSGEEAMSLLTRSSRVREDLMKVIEYIDDFKMNIIVREWFEMKPSMEFRAFVFKRKLSAISQYCYYQYFTDVVEAKDELEKRMIAFWESFKDDVPQESYVVDFVIVEDRVMIIELNPYFGDTGACLFSWHSDEDKKVLKGEAPFQFRVVEKPLDNPLTCLPPEWIDFIDKHRGREPYTERLKKKNEEAQRQREKQEKEKEEKESSSCIVS